MAGGQCSEQGPHGQETGLWDQWQEGLPLQGHHTHHIQAILSEGACLQGARGRASDEPGMSCALLGWAPTPQATRVPRGPQKPRLESEEVLSCLWAFAHVGLSASRPSPTPEVSLWGIISSKKSSLTLQLGQVVPCFGLPPMASLLPHHLFTEVLKRMPTLDDTVE